MSRSLPICAAIAFLVAATALVPAPSARAAACPKELREVLGTYVLEVAAGAASKRPVVDCASFVVSFADPAGATLRVESWEVREDADGEEHETARLRVVDLAGREVAPAVDWTRVHQRQDRLSFFDVASPDGRFVAVRLSKPRRTVEGDVGPVRIGLASTADASVRLPRPWFARDPAIGWTPDGSRLLTAGRRRGRVELWEVDPVTGVSRMRSVLAKQPTSLDFASYAREASVSADGRSIAFEAEERSVIADVATGRTRVLPERFASFPRFSPGVPAQLAILGPSGLSIGTPGGTRRVMVRNRQLTGDHQWSPSGDRIVFTEWLSSRSGGPVGVRVRLLDVATGKVRTLTTYRWARVYRWAWSADSRRLAVSLAPLDQTVSDPAQHE